MNHSPIPSFHGTCQLSHVRRRVEPCRSFHGNGPGEPGVGVPAGRFSTNSGIMSPKHAGELQPLQHQKIEKRWCGLIRSRSSAYSDNPSWSLTTYVLETSISLT